MIERWNYIWNNNKFQEFHFIAQNVLVVYSKNIKYEYENMAHNFYEYLNIYHGMPSSAVTALVLSFRHNKNQEMLFM